MKIRYKVSLEKQVDNPMIGCNEKNDELVPIPAVKYEAITTQQAISDKNNYQ